MAMVDEKWGNQQVAAYDSSYNKANYWGKKSIKISFGRPPRPLSLTKESSRLTMP